MKYHIMKWVVVIKLFLNKYVRKNVFQTEERITISGNLEKPYVKLF